MDEVEDYWHSDEIIIYVCGDARWNETQHERSCSNLFTPFFLHNKFIITTSLPFELVLKT